MSRKIVVLYGSQTGTAQDVSENIWRESKRFYFNGGVKSMDEYNVQDLIEEEIAIFVCSTTGQGGEFDTEEILAVELMNDNFQMSQTT
jgi:sulfite reductase alpha subunit-like flavoprotein